LAILKRLLVVSMGAAVVWGLQRSESVEATEFKRVLVRLSSKSQNRGSPPTAGTLLSGLFVLLRIFDFLDSIDNDLTQIDNLRTILTNVIPNLAQKFV
jgi:amino acid transporter